VPANATNCSEERSFSKFRRIKNELKGHNIPGQGVHTKDWCIKIDKLKQTNFNDFGMKKARKKTF